MKKHPNHNAPAQNNPEKFHGTGPFDIKTGDPITLEKIPTYSSVFGKTAVSMAEEDEHVVNMGSPVTPAVAFIEFLVGYAVTLLLKGVSHGSVLLREIAEGAAVEGRPRQTSEKPP